MYNTLCKYGKISTDSSAIIFQLISGLYNSQYFSLPIFNAFSSKISYHLDKILNYIHQEVVLASNLEVQHLMDYIFQLFFGIKKLLFNTLFLCNYQLHRLAFLEKNQHL